MSRLRTSWLQQVDRHLKEIGMGQASAWGMARLGPWSTGRKWTQRRDAPVHAPIPDLTCDRSVEHGPDRGITVSGPV